MPLGNPTGGFAFSPEYQSSALPWVTSSIATSAPQEWDFNYITRFIAVTNQSSSGTLSLAFTWSGSIGNNKFIIPPSGYVNIEMRVSKVFIRNETGSGTGAPNYSLAVGLTTIPAGMMPPLTSSFPDGTAWAGVG